MPSADQVAHELILLVRALKGMHSAVTAEVGLRLELPGLSVLSLLEDHGRQRPSALADLLQLDLSSVSRQVAALEREGWLEREPDPADQRAQLLAVSPAGVEVLLRIRQARAALLRRALPDWSEQDLAAFAGSLRRFSTDLSAARSSSPTSRPTALAGAGQEAS